MSWDVYAAVAAVREGRLQFQHPEHLIIAGAAAILAAVVLWWPRHLDTGSGSHGKRVLFLLSRVLIASLVAAAIATPFTTTVDTRQGDAAATVLVDTSASMNLYNTNTTRFTDRLEQQLPVTVEEIGQQNRSALGDSLLQQLRPNTHYLLISDGHVTHGTTLQEAATFFQRANASLSTIQLGTNQREASVSINGPATATENVENTFLINLDAAAENPEPVPVTVRINGVVVAERETSDSFTVNHVFERSGAHTVTADIQVDDRWQYNNRFQKTVKIVEPPDVLYVGDTGKPLYAYLNQLYNVTARSQIPEDVEPYYATVINDEPVNGLGDVAALQDYVINGNGLAVVGGFNAFNHGNYEDSVLEQMLPVTATGTGETRGGANLVFLIDRSKSTEDTIEQQKALAVSAFESLSLNNNVGAAALGATSPEEPVPVIASVKPLAAHRETLINRVKRVTFDGVAFFNTGLEAAEKMLDRFNTGQNIVLISDGQLEAYNRQVNDEAKAKRTAARLAEEGFRIITIGVGTGTDTEFLQELADAGNGVFFKAENHRKLNILFGEVEDGAAEQSFPLVVLDAHHFITSGLELSTTHNRFNPVEVKPGADTLVTSTGGIPSIAAWRFGVGRVATVTTFDAAGHLGQLLENDPEAVTRTVNWVIGHPERKQSFFVTVNDARTGEQVQVTVKSRQPPTAEDLRFTRTGDDEYTASFPAPSPGRYSVVGAEYAVNYPREYEDLGQSQELVDAVQRMNGDVFQPDAYNAIAEHIRELSRQRHVTRAEFTGLFILAALILYFMEVAVRRVATYYTTWKRRGEQ